MAARHATLAHVSELAETIEARWWKKGRRRRSTAAAVGIQSECALTYMNAVFRQNLSEVLAVDANDARYGTRHQRRTR